MISSFPRLETDRLILRQLRTEDAANLFEIFSMDEVTQYYNLDNFVAIEQAEQLIERWNQRFEEGQSIRWGIALRSDDRIIGTCGYHNWRRADCKAEIGYELNPNHWSKGLMTEAVNRIVSFGFEEMQLNRIEAYVFVTNTASQKLLEKSGFHQEGLLQECYRKNDSFIDALLFAKLQKDHAENVNDKR